MIALDFKESVPDCAAGAQPRLQFLEQCLPIFFLNLETLDYRMYNAKKIDPTLTLFYYL